jgi:hypothetical protein
MAPATYSATDRDAVTSSTSALTTGLRDIAVCPELVLRSFTVERGPILLRKVVLVEGERRGAAAEHVRKGLLALDLT